MSRQNKIPLIWLIVLGIILAILYFTFSTKSLGVYVSCEENKIIGIRNVPPPLMTVYQQKICDVNISVIDTSSKKEICNKFVGIYSSERGVIECKELKNYEGKITNITAIFHNDESNETGSTSVLIEIKN